MDLRWSPYLTPLNWNIPGRWFPHGKAGGKVLRCDMFECAPWSVGGVKYFVQFLFQLICNLWDGPMKHWGCGGERKRVSQRKVGEFDAYFDFSHSHFPLKLACLKGYLAASTYPIYIYIHIYIYTSLNYVITYVSNNHGSGTALFVQLEDFYCFFSDAQ